MLQYGKPGPYFTFLLPTSAAARALMHKSTQKSYSELLHRCVEYLAMLTDQAGIYEGEPACCARELDLGGARGLRKCYLLQSRTAAV